MVNNCMKKLKIIFLIIFFTPFSVHSMVGFKESYVKKCLTLDFQEREFDEKTQKSLEKSKHQKKFIKTITKLKIIGYRTPKNVKNKENENFLEHIIQPFEMYFDTLSIKNSVINNTEAKELFSLFYYSSHQFQFLKNLKIKNTTTENLNPLNSSNLDSSVKSFIPNLEKLNLSNNQITIDAVIQISKAIQNHLTLTFLNLSHNQIEDIGSILIARAIQNHSNFTSLNLSHNQ